jgi:general stress protein 26
MMKYTISFKHYRTGQTAFDVVHAVSPDHARAVFQNWWKTSFEMFGEHGNSPELEILEIKEQGRA